MQGRTRNRLQLIVGFSLFFAAVMFFWDSPVVFPVKLFVVLLHELSHGFAGILTGGRIVEIEINAQQGGHCVVAGGNFFVTASAGYLGSLAWGALMVWGSTRFPGLSKRFVVVIALLILATTALYIRDPYTVLATLCFGAAFLATARFGGETLNRLFLLGLGLTSCLYAVLDIKSDVLDRPELMSDARILAGLTGVPTLVWGMLWIGIAIGVCGILFRWFWRRA